MTPKMKRIDELRILQLNLEKVEWAINRARGDLENAQKTLTYINEKLQKIINSYNSKNSENHRP